ncbi:LysE/ArgO family amino acid transporter [Motilimonas sp. 1_MG-2023]|uniref:LysE/ArgO family amino acid transporter n=1 Tax=unclassified Motilimonas TaxID=2643697 RepID=UPI001E2D8E7E|nr:LysE/ArgO family amino acid transporter [Motilimonas sp. 1_MG-2023]MCE0557517.1 LysE/ArgO family amino acid transporter [Motilimonas sp. E26]MDO6524598.1 LysE/ArgO family amino acid transporter [Motilimonas sp. 1_MG-2023]
MDIFVTGLLLGFSLIIAIGSQNAFVLRQGLKGQHVLLVCTICALSDAALIALGVAGFGVLVKQAPWIEQFARYAGALFLIVYGARSLWAAINHKADSLAPASDTFFSIGKVVLTCLAFTWLNPHVYLDTVILLGSISTQYGAQKWLFGFGAMLASLLFFFALGFGSRLLVPLFANPLSWRLLDFVIAGIMWFIAASLIL